MRKEDLDLRELLDFDPSGGLIRFGGERVLLLDAVAMGILRRELIDTLGAMTARCVLTRFGYAHGRRTAEAGRDHLPWDSAADWQHGGERLHALQGLVIVEPMEWTDEDGPRPLACGTWRHSYEAEQHRLHMGLSDEAVCWTLCGFVSGYHSYSQGRHVICIERACQGCGDAVCELVARFEDDWSEEEIAPHRVFYQADSVDKLLTDASRTLKSTESRLRRRRAELSRLQDEATADLVAAAPAMAKTVDLARRVAPYDTTVLLRGETGVGKERVARLIHQLSARRDKPFFAVNCGAVQETLLESELFGHARGAYTGASKDHAGLFEAATGGTLLLDEIGEASPALQVKLLRVLQEGEIRRLGETRSRAVDIRVLAATHRDLASEVAAGRFREDLLYRLRVMETEVPPARRRREDLLILARSFITDGAARFQKKVLGLTPAAADRILAYGWPGNVRELQHAIERALILCDGPRIDVDDLPPELRHAALPDPTERLSDVERRHIEAVLERHDGHREKTAEALGIGVATLYRKLKQYGVG